MGPRADKSGVGSEKILTHRHSLSILFAVTIATSVGSRLSNGVEATLLLVHIIQHPNTTRHFRQIQRLRGPILLSLLQTLDQRSGGPLNCG
jgi:hypothetical protein